MSLFEDTYQKDTKRKLAKTMDSIRHKHGKCHIKLFNVKIHMNTIIIELNISKLKRTLQKL